MHLTPDVPKGEELSLMEGAAPKLGFRGWLHAHVRLVAIVVSITLLVAIGASGWYVFRRSSGPLLPPDGPWPQHGGISVVLCKDDSPFESCGRREVTAAQKREIEARLRARSEVVAVSFTSRKQAYADFLTRTKNDPLAQRNVRLEDMPESFVGTLRAGDWSDLQQALKELPGVSNVIASRESFWPGKADVAVSLCRVDSAGKSPCANHTREANEEEKDTVFERLKALKGVDKIYFEDREHSRKVNEHMLPGNSLNSLWAGESFFVKFRSSPDLRAVEDAVRNLPAVSAVSPIVPRN